MGDDLQGVRGWLRRYGEDVGYGLAVDLGKKIVLWGGGAIVVALGVLIWKGGDVPAWLLVPAAVVAALVPAVVLRRTLPRQRAELQEAEEIVAAFGDALERHEAYSGHVARALDELQRIVSQDINVSIPSFIELGVLQPARDVIEDKPAEHVRLSVLLPAPDHDGCWSMPFAAGHSLTGKSKYRVPISETLSRHAYESGDSQRWGDVAQDSGFRQNPEASHDTRSMISLPLRWGDQIVGVFNVISSEPHAFDPAEETYIRRWVASSRWPWGCSWPAA